MFMTCDEEIDAKRVEYAVNRAEVGVVGRTGICCLEERIVAVHQFVSEGNHPGSDCPVNFAQVICQPCDHSSLELRRRDAVEMQVHVNEVD